MYTVYFKVYLPTCLNLLKVVGKNIFPKWWWNMAIYHGTIRKKMQVHGIQILSVLFRWWRTPLLWQYDWMPPVWQLLQDVARVLWVVSPENKSYNHTEQGVWKDPFQLRPFGGPNTVFSWKRLWICCESQILNSECESPVTTGLWQPFLLKKQYGSFKPLYLVVRKWLVWNW